MKALRIDNFKNGLSCLLVFIIIISSDVFACTAFYASSKGLILVGNNEDWWDPDAKVWFISPKENKYGRVYFGFDDFEPQGGLNDHGLFFDGFATLLLPIKQSINKPVYAGNLIDKVMSECATVDEVLEVLAQYNLQFLETAMLMFGDSTGQSVIIEGDRIIRKKGNYQIVSNFYQSLSEPEEYYCWRYNKAKGILDNHDTISIALFRKILNATHQNGTQYSNIYDLKNGIIYLYHFHNYEHVVKIILREELQKGNHTYDIPSLFPKNEKFIKAYYSKITPNNNFAITVIVLFCSLIFLSVLLLKPFSYILRVIKKNRVKSLEIFQGVNLITKISFLAVLFISLFNAGYLFILSYFSFDKVIHVTNIAMPHSLVNLNLLQKVIILIPAILILPTFASLIFTYILWKNRQWTKFERYYYTIVSISALSALLLYKYWDLIKL